jgi:hypothetical protein
MYDPHRGGRLNVTESPHPSSYYPDTIGLVGQRLSQQPLGGQHGITDNREEMDDYCQSHAIHQPIVPPQCLDDGTGSTYSFAAYERLSQQLDERTARVEQATGTISGIIRNYQDPRVGVASASEQEVDYSWKDQPLLSRTESQHREDYYRVHGRYPKPHFRSPTRSDTTVDENNSTFSGEDLMRSPESNQNLIVSSEGHQLPSDHIVKSSVRRQPISLMKPLTTFHNRPGDPPTNAPPHTPDTPRPLYFKDVPSGNFSNLSNSYTSTGQLLATTSPLLRVEQPPSNDWPFQGSQSLPKTVNSVHLSSTYEDHEASNNRGDFNDLYADQAGDGGVGTQNLSHSIPRMWTRQPSGPSYLRRENYNDSEGESFADMSDEDPVQPRLPQASSGGSTVRNSGTDWETIPNGTSMGGSQPELLPPRRKTYDEMRRDEHERRAKDAGKFDTYIKSMVAAAPEIHAAAPFLPSYNAREDFLLHSPYAMHENWAKETSPIDHGMHAYRSQAYQPHRQRPVQVADDDLSPEPNDGIEYDDERYVRSGFDDAHATRLGLRDSQLSYHYPTTQTADGYFPPRVSSMVKHHIPAPLSRPTAQVITEPPEAYLGQRSRAWTRSDAPTASYAGSHDQVSHTRSVDPLVSHNDSTLEIEMSSIAGARRYSRLPMGSSLRNSVRRSVARQTDLQPLHLSPANARESAVTDVTTWGGFMNYLKASGHGSATPPPLQHVKNTPGVMARQTALRRQESASYLLPYATNLEGQMSSDKNVHRHAYHFSVLILCVSAVFIIFLPLYFWGALDLLIQKYTNGTRQSYPRKLKSIAIAIFSVEISSIIVAALMGGLMGRK